jgi:hypothetical protein
MIVYIDETGWKVGDKSCYTWVFSTSMHVLYRCGVSRKKTEATDILGESFGGIGVTDDYAAYQNLFNQHQLCWAHLIRKAIKLALQSPDELEYAEFLDGLCSIYDDAKQLRQDALAATDDANPDEPAQPAAIVKQLQDRVLSLCHRREETIITPKAAAKSEPAIEPTSDPVSPSFFFNANWQTTSIACSCLSSTRQSSRPTIEANATSVVKQKFAKGLARARPHREQNVAAPS